jgi:hypothetical protein
MRTGSDGDNPRSATTLWRDARTQSHTTPYGVLASCADLIRAAQLRSDLGAEYAELEYEIGHRFLVDQRW